jgi:hypothetical protein
MQAHDHYHLADPLEGADAILACKIRQMQTAAFMRCCLTVSGTFCDIEHPVAVAARKN